MGDGSEQSAMAELLRRMTEGHDAVDPHAPDEHRKPRPNKQYPRTGEPAHHGMEAKSQPRTATRNLAFTAGAHDTGLRVMATPHSHVTPMGRRR